MKNNYFKFGNGMCHRDAIEWVEIGSVWGEIKLKGKPTQAIGNGSYANDGKHISHKVVDFERLQEIIDETLTPPSEEKEL